MFYDFSSFTIMQNIHIHHIWSSRMCDQRSPKWSNLWRIKLGMDQKRKISQSREYHNSKRKLRFGFIVCLIVLYRFSTTILWLFMALMSFMFCGQKWLQINSRSSEVIFNGYFLWFYYLVKLLLWWSHWRLF